MLFEASKLLVKFFGSFYVRVLCVFKTFEKSNVFLFVIYRYGYTPFFMLFVPIYTFMPAFISYVSLSILTVLRVRGLSEIFPSIIKRVFILMVDDTLGPVSGRVQPCDSMRSVRMSVYFYDAFRTLQFRLLNVSGFASRVSGLQARWQVWAQQPFKYAGIRIVMKDRPYVGCSEVVAKFNAMCFADFSHCLTLRRSLWLEAGKRWNASCLDLHSMELAPCQ